MLSFFSQLGQERIRIKKGNPIDLILDMTRINKTSKSLQTDPEEVVTLVWKTGAWKQGFSKWVILKSHIFHGHNFTGWVKLILVC